MPLLKNTYGVVGVRACKRYRGGLLKLTFEGDFDTNATLTFTVGADVIAGYNQGFTAEIPVTAIQKSRCHGEYFTNMLVVSPDVGEELTFSINIAGGENVVGYQATVSFDDSALTAMWRVLQRLSTSGRIFCGYRLLDRYVSYLGSEM